jgi:hypothetical protein
MGHNIEQGAGGLSYVELQRLWPICPKTFETDCSYTYIILISSACCVLVYCFSAHRAIFSCSIQSVGYSPCSSYQRPLLLRANEIDQLMPTTMSIQSKISSIRQNCIYISLPTRAQNTVIHHSNARRCYSWKIGN